jgi:hypothetical protein
MSKNELNKRLENLEIKKCPEKTIVLRMWCPGGKTTHINNDRLRIIPSNPEDAEL